MMEALRILLVVVVPMIACAVAEGDAASDAEKAVAAWLADLDKAVGEGAVWSGKTYQALRDLGPNVLPALAAAARSETYPGKQYALAEAMRQSGQFYLYYYASGPPGRGKAVAFFCNRSAAEVPPFSLDNDQFPDGMQRLRAVVEKTLQWWDQRGTFLQGRNVKEELRKIVGRTPEEFAAYDEMKDAQLLALDVYGIYNVPAYIEVVAEDNNPAAFGRLLGLLNIRLRLASDADFGPHARGWQRVKTTQEEYPTVADKMSILCKGWAACRDTYSLLTDLRDAIDARMQKFCPKQD